MACPERQRWMKSKFYNSDWRTRCTPRWRHCSNPSTTMSSRKRRTSTRRCRSWTCTSSRSTPLPMPSDACERRENNTPRCQKERTTSWQVFLGSGWKPTHLTSAFSLWTSVASPHGTALMAFADIKCKCLRVLDRLVSTHPFLELERCWVIYLLSVVPFWTKTSRKCKYVKRVIGAKQNPTECFPFSGEKRRRKFQGPGGRLRTSRGRRKSDATKVRGPPMRPANQERPRRGAGVIKLLLLMLRKFASDGLWHAFSAFSNVRNWYWQKCPTFIQSTTKRSFYALVYFFALCTMAFFIINIWRL